MFHQNIPLILFWLMILFCTPWKHSKIFSFLVFLRFHPFSLCFPVNPFLASVPILCPLKTFQGYRTRPLTWNELISSSFLTYISNFFLPNVPFWSPWKYQKPNIFYTLLRTRTCAYQGVKNLRFFDVSTGIKREHWEDKS